MMSSSPFDEPSSKCKYSPFDQNASSYSQNDDLNPKDDDMTFCMSNYAKEAMKMMFMMRSHQMLTDVILEVKQELFHAHKVVLSAASPYFKAMFTGGLKECEMSRIKLQGVCPTAMGRIIYFMYTGQIRVTEVTVCQLLPAATMFQVPNVIEACCAFLERQLDPTNAIGIANFAEQHGCITLQQKANQFIERHFTQICQEEEFLQLSAYQLIALIRKDELNVQEERVVYNAVLKWVKYDEENRYPKMEHILYAVRCQFLTPNFLKEQMKNCDVLRKVPACREYLAQIFKDLTLHKKPIVKERKPNTTRMIFVAGGFYRQSLDILEGYNVDDKLWITLPKLRIPRSGLGAAFLKGTFYAVGGRNNSIGSSYDSDWVDRYNAVTEQWRPCSPMSVPRHRVGVAVMDELLYAVGGSAGSEYHNSVEYYDPEQDRWTLVQPMHSKRLGVGIAVVNRLLYAIGGFNGHERLASVECYHPENNEWTIIPPMQVGRSGAGVAAINQHIYVVGGFDGTRQLSSVERYDTENQTWDMVASIKIARSALSLTALDGKLYAMGGFDGNNFLSIVEVYDPKLNEWHEGTPLTSGRSGHASAVIYQPSCITTTMDYSDDITSSSSFGDGDADGNGMGNSNSRKNDTSNASSSPSPFMNDNMNSYCHSGGGSNDGKGGVGGGGGDGSGGMCGSYSFCNKIKLLKCCNKKNNKSKENSINSKLSDVHRRDDNRKNERRKFSLNDYKFKFKCQKRIKEINGLDTRPLLPFKSEQLNQNDQHFVISSNNNQNIKNDPLIIIDHERNNGIKTYEKRMHIIDITKNNNSPIIINNFINCVNNNVSLLSKDKFNNNNNDEILMNTNNHRYHHKKCKSQLINLKNSISHNINEFIGSFTKNKL